MRRHRAAACCSPTDPGARNRDDRHHRPPPSTPTVLAAPRPLYAPPSWPGLTRPSLPRQHEFAKDAVAVSNIRVVAAPAATRSPVGRAEMRREPAVSRRLPVSYVNPDDRRVIACRRRRYRHRPAAGRRSGWPRHESLNQWVQLLLPSAPARRSIRPPGTRHRGRRAARNHRGRRRRLVVFAAGPPVESELVAAKPAVAVPMARSARQAQNMQLLHGELLLS